MSDNQISILLVEDDDVDIMNIQRAFKKIKITNPLHIAKNGVEALEMLRRQDESAINPLPKIILLDLNMPKMNGIEFLTELRADPVLKPICVFVLTTSDDERDKVAAYNLNVAGYILKPVDSANFIETVSTLGLFWSLIEMP